MDGEVEGHVLKPGEPKYSQEKRNSMVHRIVAPLLSLMMPGAGQLFNRHWVKGSVFIVIVMLFSGWVRRQMISEEVSSLTALNHSPYVIAALVVFLGLGVWSIIDAYRDAALTHKF